MSYPILYSFRRCPYAMRARLALEAGDIKVELREIVLRDKAPEFLEASPKGTVPVMVLPDGMVLEESLDIIRWAMNTSKTGRSLAPDQANVKDALALIKRMDMDFKPHLDRFKYPSRYEGVDPLEARQKASEFLYELEDMLSLQSYLMGCKRSVADIAIAPFIRQFAHVDKDWFYAEPWPHLIVWLREFLNSYAFQKIMVKYPKWAMGDPVTFFPPSDIKTPMKGLPHAS